MNTFASILAWVQAYLLVLLIWYSALLFLHEEGRQIPQNVRDFFEKGNGNQEVLSFCFFVLYLLNAITLSIRAGLSIFYWRSFGLTLISSILLASVCLALATYFFYYWRGTVLDSRRS